MSVRNAEVYTSRALITACNLIKSESECVEDVFERLMTEGINREHPGLMAVIAECDKAIDEARKENKKRLDQWRGQWPKLPEVKPIETEPAKP
jgi:hypothetical protein